MIRIESLLSARLFLAPQIHEQRVYFISNLSGRLSLYAMNEGGSVPEPLLPPEIALQNPDLIGGRSYQVYPALSQILVMIDQDGDENYRPMFIPIQGGYPQPAFGDAFVGCRVHLGPVDLEKKMAYFVSESSQEPVQTSYRGNLETGELLKLAASPWGAFPVDNNPDHTHVVISDAYSTGDSVLFLWNENEPGLKLIEGTPIEQRQPGQIVPLNGLASGAFTEDGCGLLVLCALFTDTYGPGYLDLNHPGGIQEVQVKGIVHTGSGEMVNLSCREGGGFLAAYNIDGCSWLYEASFHRDAQVLELTNVLVGEKAPLTNGVMEAYEYEPSSGAYILEFSTATSPTQIYTLTGKDHHQVTAQTNERVLGVAPDLLSPGEDASFTSFDGTRVSARLYLPSPALGYKDPRPVVYYVHGGPQGQEQPNFAWFSMPLIQYLSLNGFAVFVPNVRGSTGYGLKYTKQVDRDWGGKDRMDHVFAMQQVLPNDPRLDISRAAVVGRSYGGYMTLTLAARHPELWSAAVDMFGPFDLLTFVDRIPATWKPYFKIALGDAVEDHDFLVERSPRTYMDQIACPLLVIQGKNDPRVVERESHDLVDYLRSQGKQVEYLMFDNEGHDVLKFENRVRCYNAITNFFIQTLKP